MVSTYLAEHQYVSIVAVKILLLFSLNAFNIELHSKRFCGLLYGAIIGNPYELPLIMRMIITMQ